MTYRRVAPGAPSGYSVAVRRALVKAAEKQRYVIAGHFVDNDPHRPFCGLMALVVEARKAAKAGKPVEVVLVPSRTHLGVTARVQTVVAQRLEREAKVRVVLLDSLNSLDSTQARSGP